MVQQLLLWKKDVGGFIWQSEVAKSEKVEPCRLGCWSLNFFGKWGPNLSVYKHAKSHETAYLLKKLQNVLLGLFSVELISCRLVVCLQSINCHCIYPVICSKSLTCVINFGQVYYLICAIPPLLVYQRHECKSALGSSPGLLMH